MQLTGALKSRWLISCRCQDRARASKFPSSEHNLKHRMNNKKLLCWSSALFTALLLFTADFCMAQHPPKVALVIGNAAYKSSPLRNPENDAKDFAKSLKGFGFTVIERTNLTTKQIGPMLREFRSKLVPGSVAVVFYAGHGVQIKGENYLPTVDADIHGEEDVPQQSLSTRQLMDVLAESGTRMNLVFLDACRNNPYSRRFRSTTRGLSRENAPSGTLMSFATRPGSEAADGDGRNGLYTSVLLQQLKLADQPIEQVLKKVVAGVKQASNGQQEPWIEGSIEGDFCFAECGGSSNARLDADDEAWTITQKSNSLVAYQAYIANFPSGRYKAAAQVALSVLKGGGNTPTNGAATEERDAPSPVPTAEPKPAPTVLPKPLPQANQTIKDCPECPELVVVPPGSFWMGSNPSEEDWMKTQFSHWSKSEYDMEWPKRWVTVSYSLAVGKYPVTQSEWQAVMGTNPSKFKGSRNPVENVSWDDAQEYIKRLNSRVGNNSKTGRYRLLSESEWEYSARAGTTTRFYWGDGLGKGNANCNGCGNQWDGRSTSPVGSFPPNAFGLYDMAGNVYQWVQDQNYIKRGIVEPANGSAYRRSFDWCCRRARGGSWFYGQSFMRPADRGGGGARSNRNDDLGFRVAKSLP